MELRRVTKDSVEEFVKQFEPPFQDYVEILDPGNSIEAALLPIGFEVINLEGMTQCPNGGYLCIDEDGYPKALQYREFEDTYMVDSPIDTDSVSGQRKLGTMGGQGAPASGPDADGRSDGLDDDAHSDVPSYVSGEHGEVEPDQPQDASIDDDAKKLGASVEGDDEGETEKTVDSQ
jgi:hypothetical protein